MSSDWYPGIEQFCDHWKHAPMLQQTFETLKQTFADGNDACIDASKALSNVLAVSSSRPWMIP